MLVSWDWLKQYVQLDLPPEEVVERLMMAGLNHEETTAVGQDLAINLEVTSNRPDCLGHLGIAREISVLLGRPLTIPAARPEAGATPVAERASVSLQSPQLCPRYTARVIRGVKVGPSPAWLVNRLATIGIASINNVVDVTNYVLMECGQPLHAFDLAKLHGRRVIVREAVPGEAFEAINHKTYTLEPGMCVIADADRPVGLAGVMGGADSEVSGATTEVLIESAQFDPLAVRNTSRRLKLKSDSSYRFERGLDPQGVDWASRRACELILEIAGGELAAGAIDVGTQPVEAGAITLRLAQLPRILGIEPPAAEVRRILAALGCSEKAASAGKIEVRPPSWRRDLTREIDLVEEVARIYGYDKIPEDARVPMAPSHRTRADRVLARARQVLVGAGFDEAMTLSAVEESWSDAFSPWTDAAPLRCFMPVLGRADRLRRSLVPSLLAARRTNESLGNETIELFEIANIYLPQREAGALPAEETMLAMTSGGDFFALKGALEALVGSLSPASKISVHPARHKLLDRNLSCELRLTAPDGKAQRLGFLGEVSDAGRKQFDLRGRAAVAEVRLKLLVDAAEIIPQYRKPPVLPGVDRDLNLVVPESVSWAELSETVRATAAPYAEALEYQDVYRDPERLGAGKKSLLMRLTLRSHEETFTNEQADAIRDRIVAACRQKHSAELRT